MPGSQLLIKPDEVLNESTIRVIQIGSCKGVGLMFLGEGVEFWSRKTKTKVSTGETSPWALVRNGHEL